MDKTTLNFKMLNKQLERIHSTLVVITAALMGDSARGLFHTLRTKRVVVVALLYWP